MEIILDIPTNVEQQQGLDRYPGPKPYDESLSPIFFGRDEEIREICDAIGVHQVFLIHGESGLGKSSLINAGILPRLRDEKFSPVLFRFKHRDKSAIENTLIEFYSAFKQLRRPQALKQSQYLLYAIKQCNLNGFCPILIFDQFEEFSVFKREYQEEFCQELNMLFSRKFSIEENEEMDDALKKTWYTPPCFKLIISLRSDKLMVIEELSRYIPMLQRNRFKLKPIAFDYARQLIVHPAVTGHIPGIKFRTSSFDMSDDVIENTLKIIKDQKTNSVETTQLQMICQEIELVVRERQKKEKKVTITGRDFSAEKLKAIPRDFYVNQLKKISVLQGIQERDILAIQILIENKMIIRDTRIPFTRLQIRNHFEEFFRPSKSKRYRPNDSELSQEQIDAQLDRLEMITDLLLEYRLLRDQPYGDVIFYEISHDALVTGISSEREKRATKEEVKRLQKVEENYEKQKTILAETTRQKELLAEQKKESDYLYKKVKRTQIRVFIVSFMFVLISIAFFIFVWLEVRRKHDLIGISRLRDGTDNYSVQKYADAFHTFLQAYKDYGKAEALQIIDSLTFPEMNGSNVFTSSSKKKLIISAAKTANVYDIAAQHPKLLLTPDWSTVGRSQFSPHERYLYTLDASGRNYIYELVSGKKYRVTNNSFSPDVVSFSMDERFLCYQTSTGIGFFALPHANNTTLKQIRLLNKLNGISEIAFSTFRNLVYIKTAKEEAIYDLNNLKKRIDLPKKIHHFGFALIQPLFYFVDQKGKLQLQDFNNKRKIRLNIPNDSELKEENGRLIVRNRRIMGKVSGVGINYQYSFVINLNSLHVFEWPRKIYKAEVSAICGEKFAIFHQDDQCFLYNGLLNKTVAIGCPGNTFFTDFSHNLVYLLDVSGKLMRYDLSNNKTMLYGDGSISAFTMDQTRTYAAFQKNATLQTRIINVRTNNILPLRLAGSLNTFIGPYLQVDQVTGSGNVNRYLLLIDSAKLKGKNKIDYLSRIYPSRPF